MTEDQEIRPSAGRPRRPPQAEKRNAKRQASRLLDWALALGLAAGLIAIGLVIANLQTEVAGLRSDLVELKGARKRQEDDLTVMKANLAAEVEALRATVAKLRPQRPPRAPAPLAATAPENKLEERDLLAVRSPPALPGAEPTSAAPLASHPLPANEDLPAAREEPEIPEPTPDPGTESHPAQPLLASEGAAEADAPAVPEPEASPPQPPGGDDATSEPAPRPAPEMTPYRVAPGDSLWRIAETHGVSARLLARINNLSNPNQIRVGQVLIIPPR